MGVDTTTTWTCDRCGGQETFPDTGQPQPDDWGSLVETVPPLADSSELGQKLGVICRPCRSDLREWMAEGGPQ